MARWQRLCLQEYSNWETDEVITSELVRNLGIALACVFLTTLLLLANFLGSLMVLLCVAIVLVYNTLHWTALKYTALHDKPKTNNHPYIKPWVILKCGKSGVQSLTDPV